MPFFFVARPKRGGELLYWTGRVFSSNESHAKLMKLRNAQTLARAQGDSATFYPMTEAQAIVHDDFLIVRRRGDYWVVLGNYTEWVYDQMPERVDAERKARLMLAEGIGKLRDERDEAFSSWLYEIKQLVELHTLNKPATPQIEDRTKSTSIANRLARLRADVEGSSLDDMVKKALTAKLSEAISIIVQTDGATHEDAMN